MLSQEKGEKYCVRCKQSKPVSEFFYKSDTKDHLSSYCKLCHRSYKKENYNAKVIKSYHLKRTYQITLGVYQKMYQEQGGVCAICQCSETMRSTKNGGTLDLAVDHDHKTGYVRGLLCRRCNQVIGLLNEDRLLLQRMIYYLARFEHERA